ncbi:MAG: hypothetical protein Q4F95_09290 [Oscillospiraceae bacterium]|nr:hypothetical protein [Oscillospiraceae bacterium]
MGHMIRGIIGKDSVMQNVSKNWRKAEKIILPQDYSLICLNDDLFDVITELIDEGNTCEYPVLNYLTTSIIRFLETESADSQLVYIETNYFGGSGTQAGVLFENGSIKTQPVCNDGAINQLLHNIGVYKEKGKDEFDSLQLYRFRHME